MYSHAPICTSVGIEGTKFKVSAILQTTNAFGQCGNRYLDLARDIGEAAYFMGSPAAKSTPHLYISALATWSQETSLSRNWKNQFNRIPVFTYSQGSIDFPLMTISAGGINGVAFSADGMQIVSGSDDCFV